MKRRDFVVRALAGAFGTGLAASGLGCYLPESPKKMPREASAQCPGCDEVMEEGTYCAKCNAVATRVGEYECPACAEVVKMGTYCPSENAFHFPPSAPKDPVCGLPKGPWCDQCKRYSGLPMVTYCPKCKKPFDATLGVCPDCKTPVENP
jgi:predicted amidophosphoribosyltransferase